MKTKIIEYFGKTLLHVPSFIKIATTKEIWANRHLIKGLLWQLKARACIRAAWGWNNSGIADSRRENSFGNSMGQMCVCVCVCVCVFKKMADFNQAGV